METIKQNILPLILIGLVIYSIFNTNTIKTDVQGYKDKINNLQTKVDSVQVVNKGIDDKIIKTNEKITEVSNDIHHIDNTITVVKNNTNEKVNNVNHIGNVELELLFSARYNQSGVIH
jgi:peptidoglycan hydrolase CwlO-like protein